ncbi:hypothetical protein [Streptomyces shenzhenensis]|uniref:MmyB family transcriptional regulator n=1 Tax=Streptomyces shenzhenensis TaxID=943815 RepID=UPI00217EBA2C|nr:hypothetical protein [Streptomyces shenzhenensis]
MPHDPALTELVGELSTRSQTFRQRWAAHDVRFHRSGVKRLYYPIVGDLDLETFELSSDPGLAMVVHTAAPGTPAADTLMLLASWAASRAPEEPEASAGAEPPR